MNSRPYDHVESSPTSRATCRICNLKIMKGDWRIGERFYLFKYKKWGLQYYHRKCVEENENILNNLNFPKKRGDNKRYARSKRKLEDVISSSNKEWIRMEINEIADSNHKRRRLIYDEKGSLREKLRKLRTRLASLSDVPPYFIFHDSVLDGLVEHMPTNEDELLKIKGMGPKKCESFGSDILETIDSYRNHEGASMKSGRCKDDSEDDNDKDDSEDDNDYVELEKALTVNEIVEQKFVEAKQKGNVIEL